MATLEELEARVAAIETGGKFASQEEFSEAQRQIDAISDVVSKIKSCTCDPSKYASQEEFEQAQRQITAIQTYVESLTVPDTSTFATKAEVQQSIGNLPYGQTIVGYVDSKGVNYYTKENKAELAQDVMAAMPKGGFGYETTEQVSDYAAWTFPAGNTQIGVKLSSEFVFIPDGNYKLAIIPQEAGVLADIYEAQFSVDEENVYLNVDQFFSLTAKIDSIRDGGYVTSFWGTSFYEASEEERTVRIDMMGEITIVHTIDPKYLPEDCGVSSEEIEGMIEEAVSGVEESVTTLGNTVTELDNRVGTLSENLPISAGSIAQLASKVTLLTADNTDRIGHMERDLSITDNRAEYAHYRIDEIENTICQGNIDPDAIARVIADLITVGNKTLANALAEWAKTIPSYQLKYSAREIEQKLSKI